MRMGHLAKNWEETCILGIRAEADRHTVLRCDLGVKELIQTGIGKHWVLFNLANDLLIAFQLD